MRRKLIIPGFVSPAQLKELFRQINEGVIDGADMEAFLEHRDAFGSMRSDDGLDAREQLEHWCSFLQRTFDVSIDRRSIGVPPPRPGYNRLVVVPHRLTLNRVVGACLSRFDLDSDTFDGFDDAADVPGDFVVDDPRPEADYAIWVKGGLSFADQDEEVAGLSADDLKEQSIVGITLRERLLYELKHFAEVREHLDDGHSLTLCSGSRFRSTSQVPLVSWEDDTRRFEIHGTSPDTRSEHVATRQVAT